MAKLKYDRPINVDTSSGRTIYVPDNEVWKVTADERNLGPTTNIYGGGIDSSVRRLSLVSPLSISTTRRAMEGVVLHG